MKAPVVRFFVAALMSLPASGGAQDGGVAFSLRSVPAAEVWGEGELFYPFEVDVTGLQPGEVVWDVECRGAATRYWTAGFHGSRARLKAVELPSPLPREERLTCVARSGPPNKAVTTTFSAGPVEFPRVVFPEGELGLKVTTVPAAEAWRAGVLSPFSAEVTGVGARDHPVDVTCSGRASTYFGQSAAGAVRLQAAQLPKTLPSTESLSCAVKTWGKVPRTASFSVGEIPFPSVTFPDLAVRAIDVVACAGSDAGALERTGLLGSGRQPPLDLCFDVGVNRSGSGATGVPVDVSCDLNPDGRGLGPRYQRLLSTRTHGVTVAATTASRIPMRTWRDSAGSRLRCEVDPANSVRESDEANNARAVDLPAMPSPALGRPAKFSVEKAEGPILHEPGCGNCSGYVPESWSLRLRVRGTETADTGGLGIDCRYSDKGGFVGTWRPTEPLPGGVGTAELAWYGPEYPPTNAQGFELECRTLAFDGMGAIRTDPEPARIKAWLESRPDGGSGR